jgi:hypothetical protein
VLKILKAALMDVENWSLSLVWLDVLQCTLRRALSNLSEALPKVRGQKIPAVTIHTFS